MAEGGGAGVPSAPRGPFLREYEWAPGFRHTSARIASVLFYRNGGYSVLTLAGAEHHGKRTMARPRTVCEIALGTFTSGLRLELPAAGGTSFFTAEVDIQWSAADPYLVATKVVEDVARHLDAPILNRLREVSSQYPVTQSERAEKRLMAYCADGRWDDLGSEIGLKVRLYVRLRTDEQGISHATELRTEHHSARVLGVREEKMLAMLRGGQLDMLAFMLASKPAEARDFMERIRQEGRQDEKERVAAALDLIESGKVHSVELEQQVLDELSRGPYRIRGVLGPAPVLRDPSPPRGGADDPFTPEWVVEQEPAHADGGSLWGDDRPEPPRRDHDDRPPRRDNDDRPAARGWGDGGVGHGRRDDDRPAARGWEDDGTAARGRDEDGSAYGGRDDDRPVARGWEDDGTAARGWEDDRPTARGWDGDRSGSRGAYDGPAAGDIYDGDRPGGQRGRGDGWSWAEE